ncbi:sigma-70 family RNA polymerase sigma factor [Xanthobacter autotrophicus DSM 431]|uniref:RNA polymerase sigma factor n=1 Tax=Xanthobacter nonsaccharivorans TaxID=3119912 RepID=UPI003729CF50
MSGFALDRVFRAASGRIVAALAVRFRDLSLAEDAFSESCLRAMGAWPQSGVPADPAAWLYRAAERIALDALRRQRTRERLRPEPPPGGPNAEDLLIEDASIMPDERLRLIFICCHPAVAPDSRAALTLRLVCGLTVSEIARAFLVQETTLAQRLVRAKHKITEAGVPFELPPPQYWSDRLEAVLVTLEIAYSKAHEDGGATGRHAGFAAEVLRLTRLLAELMPESAEVHALAALVRYAEARRPARLDKDGVMVPLSEQNPAIWRRDFIADADLFLAKADESSGEGRVIQARLQRAWSKRHSLKESPPWAEVLALYDQLLLVRDDVVVRLNRAVAVAEIDGPDAALHEIDRLSNPSLAGFLPYHAVRADLLRRSGQSEKARTAYLEALALDPSRAERLWLERTMSSLPPA